MSTYTYSGNEVSASWTHSPNEVSASWTHSPNEVSASWTYSAGETAASWTYAADETSSSYLETELMQFGFLSWEGVSYKWEDTMAYRDTWSASQQGESSGKWEDLG